MNAIRQGQVKPVALLAFTCAIFFTLTIVVAHIITDKLTFISSTLSLYALEEYGFIVELGFISIGLTQLLLAFLLFVYIGARQSLLISLCLLFSGTGAIAVAIFPTLPPPASIGDRLPHIMGAIMQFFFFPLAALLLSAQMTNTTIKAYSRSTGHITALLFIVMLALFLLPTMKDFAYFGLIEKIDILAINFWLIVISMILYRSPPGSQPFLE